MLSCSSRSLFRTSRQPKPSCQQQTPLKVLMPLPQADSYPMHFGTQNSRPQTTHTNPPTSTQEASEDPQDNLKTENARHLNSRPLSPRTPQPASYPHKAVHKRDQSIESSQYTSTRAFFESLTKPTHEDTELQPTRTTRARFSTGHSSNPLTPFTHTGNKCHKSSTSLQIEIRALIGEASSFLLGAQERTARLQITERIA